MNIKAISRLIILVVAFVELEISYSSSTTLNNVITTEHITTKTTQTTSTIVAQTTSTRLRTTQTRSTRLRTTQTRSTRLRTTHTRSTRLRTTQTRSTRLRTTQTRSTRLRTTKLTEPKIVKTTSFNTRQLFCTRIFGPCETHYTYTCMCKNKVYGVPRFILTWEQPTDLDLHVYDPNNEQIAYYHRNSSLGGFLSIDLFNTQNSIEVVSFQNNNPGTILHGNYTCTVSYYACYSTPCNPIGYNVHILTSSNENSSLNEWQRFHGVITSPANPEIQYVVATITI